MNKDKSLSLWGDLPSGDDITPPITILKEQAEILGRRTKGTLKGLVWHFISVNTISIRLDILAQNLDDYSMTVIRIEQPLFLYPLRIFNEITNEEHKVENEEKFIRTLHSILSSYNVKRVIKEIFSQNKNISSDDIAPPVDDIAPPGDDITPPITILKKQAEILETKTKGTLKGLVWHFVSVNIISIRLDILAQNLDGYSMTVLRIEQPLYIYPLKIFNEITNEEHKVENEEEFIRTLHSILSSNDVKREITVIFSQSKNKITF